VVKKASRQRICKYFELFEAQMPDPQTELHYRDAYTLLVAVVLSAQSTDKGVNKATARLFELASTPQKMADLPLEELEGAIQTIGLYRNKAKHVKALSQQLCERFSGQVPEVRADLESLPGVGRKTANVVLNVAFGKPTIPVDTHIFRLAHRLGLSQGKTPLAVEKDLEAGVPELYKPKAHHYLILHGRYVCKAQKPLCQKCFLQDICPSSLTKRSSALHSRT
jgi:endonuclease-3